MYWLNVGVAYLVDLAVGDPQWLTHPVVIIGNTITKAEGLLRRYLAPFLGVKIAGVFLTLSIVTGSWLLTWLILKVITLIDPLLSRLVSIWLISTTIASKSLASAAHEIKNLLASGDLMESRKKLGWIVGRDTANLGEEEVVRATVETVAENIVDGIIAPMFYGLLGGAPLAMAYRATNTLDSMVGYKNDKYRQFGWASARWDDVMNYLPTRLTVLLLMLGALCMRMKILGAAHMVLRDAAKHPSPNSGYPEAAVAGALGVRLGGLNHYDGQPSLRALMGDDDEKLRIDHITHTTNLMYFAGSFLALAFLVAYATLH